nr:unnamed protein product [Digitaria exilis]CAB3455727.1 unnamed protein product [Digitaria exilis]
MGACCLRRRLCLGGTRTPPPPFVRRFTAREVEAATRGFTAVLDADAAGGARGTAYRARFAGGLVATVRRAGAGEDGGKAAFYLELQLLARLNHRHLVRLRGFADGHHARFLPLLFPRQLAMLSTDEFLTQEYLYYFCDPPVFHVSVNSGNVLMDSNFVAKVEQRRAGLVFEYGVLVLELVTGQSPGSDGELVRWVQEPGFAGTMNRMVDADLGGVYDARELRDLVIVARLCTRRSDDDDDVISIPQIVRYLQGKVERLGGEARC